MATECPIRIVEGGDRWRPVLKKSTRYKSPSGKMSIEDLGLLLREQHFRSPENDIMPCRSESAPPSIEGSIAALGNIFSFKRSADSTHSSLLFTTEGELHSHADGLLRYPGNCLSIHKEESEDDQSSERSCSLSTEKATTILGYSSTSFDSKQEDCGHSPSYDQYNSHGYMSRGQSTIFDTNLDISRTVSVSAETNTPCSDEMSQISSLDGTRDVVAEKDFKPVNTQDNISSGEVINEDGARGNSVFNSLVLNNKDQFSQKNNVIQQMPHLQVPNIPGFHGSYPQIVYPSITSAYGGFNQLHNVSSSNGLTTNAQPVLHASGYTPPLYANNAFAFMASSSGYYPNLLPTGYIAPQYNMAGVFPSYLAGYPHQSVLPCASFLTSGSPNGANVHPQNFAGFYGQAGIPTNPSIGMGYFRPSLYDSYGHQTSQDGVGVGVNQPDSFYTRKSLESVGLSNENKSQHLLDTSLRRRNTESHYYVGSPRNDPTSFAKSVSGTGFSGGRYNNTNQSKTNEQRQCWDDLNSYSFLEELKSGKGQRFELSDITGHIVEFSVDQHGSRFIQQKLEVCSIEEKESVLKEVILHASKLMTDVFGNYVIQKLFEYGSPDQRKCLTSQLEGQILNLSLQMYGCRVIQKALEAIDLEQKTRLARELDGHILRCVRDQNGNHVVQKCIESIPTDNIHFIISAFRGQVASLSMHPYGCRVIQRVLEHCSDDKQTQFIVDEILESVCSLARDQYGNYVTQHVLERGKPQERTDIIVKLAGSILQLSQHKFASNVIEKCIEYSNASARDLLMKDVISDQNDNLLIMMKDQYANYVVQKLLEKSSGEQKETLLGMIRNHLNTLKKYTYGKHIVARFERLCGAVEENRNDSRRK